MFLVNCTVVWTWNIQTHQFQSVVKSKQHTSFQYAINVNEGCVGQAYQVKGTEWISWNRKVINARGVWHLCLLKAGQTGRAYSYLTRVKWKSQRRVIRPLSSNHRAHENMWRRSFENNLEASVLYMHQCYSRMKGKITGKQLKRKTNKFYSSS